MPPISLIRAQSSILLQTCLDITTRIILLTLGIYENNIRSVANPDLSELVIGDIREFVKENNLTASAPVKTADETSFLIYTPAFYNYLVTEGYRTSRVVSDEPTDPEDGVIEINIRKILDNKTEPQEERVFYLAVNDRTFRGRIGTDVHVVDQSETDQRLLAHFATALRAFPSLSQVTW